jgi:hypothetical protein
MLPNLYLAAMKRALLFALIFAVPALAAPVPLESYVGGRALARSVGGETTYTYQWPGVYFEARFSGDSVDVKVDDDQNNLYLYIDGVHKLTLTKPGRTTIALKDLAPGEHVVRLEKSSETQSTTGKFEGFFVPSPDRALPPPQYDRRIEFIGDSYTVGYGNQSRGQDCTADDVAATTDTSQSFAALTAKQFNAAYRIDAFSGRGVVRNYNGIVPGETLPALYKYTLFDKSAAAPGDGWTPDVVVIGLGTNDFSTPLNIGEKWAAREELRVDFVNTYVAFIKSLHAKWPMAHIILMASNKYEYEITDAVRAAAESARTDGITDLETILFSGLDWQACQAHPSLKDDRFLAQLLIDRIAQLPKFH